MAKLEPFPFALILPDREAKGPPGLPLSVASLVEEPDLRRGQDEDDDWAGLREHRHLQLNLLASEQRLSQGDGPGFVLAVQDGVDGCRLGVYCRYPIKWIRELHDEQLLADAAAITAPAHCAAYSSLIRLSACMPDPLVLAVPEIKPEAVAQISGLGRVIARYEVPGEGTLVFREVIADRDMRAVAKLFEPGFFSAKPHPFIVDGPLAHAAERARAGDAHIFACLVPVGPGLVQMRQQELVVERLVSPLSSIITSDPIEVSIAESAAFNPRGSEDESARFSSTDGSAGASRSPMTRLAEVKRVLRYHFSCDVSREDVLQDWIEDQRIEAKVADACAMLVRGLDEFLIAVANPIKDPIAVSALYGAKALLPIALRRSLDPPGSASAAFARGYGHIAIWPIPLEPSEVTPRLLKRRPSLAARRALVGVDLPLRGASVLHLGVR